MDIHILPLSIYSRGKIAQTLNVIKANIIMPPGNAGIQADFGNSV
jgi:hypothetical protein